MDQATFLVSFVGELKCGFAEVICPELERSSLSGFRLTECAEEPNFSP